MSYKSLGIGAEDWLLGNISIPPPKKKKKKKISSWHGVCVYIYIILWKYYRCSILVYIYFNWKISYGWIMDLDSISILKNKNKKN